MILHIRHRGLRRLYQDDDRRGVNPEQVDKLRSVLARLDLAAKPTDLALPALRLHPLKGEFADFWAVTVRANWRVIFRFDGANVTDVDFIDYH